jgi:glucose-1-phosphate cytidylyltransferase
VAIILCGGRGRRLGTAGQKQPKAMVQVIGYPMIWYTIMRLYSAGVRHFILPLGYRGAQIQAYIDKVFGQLNARIDAIHTGEDSSIGKRIHLVRHLLPEQPFLLVNGDCLFDFEFDALYQSHADDKALATLTACRVVSQYGLIVVRNEKVVSFSRDSVIRAFNIENGEKDDLIGYVNAGITLLDRSSLQEVDLLETTNFEADLFSRLIGLGRVKHFLIDQYWFAVETQKDLDIVNSGEKNDPRALGVAQLRDSLMLRQAAMDLGLPVLV